MVGPLDGVRVLEMAAVVAGPLATMILADQGAEVIKVEPPGQGDLIRVPTFARGGLSAAFMNCNRGKQSLVVDLATAEGREVVLDVARTCDVVVQNFRPGVVERLGVGYDEIKSVRDDIIYVSMSGYGASGPYHQRRVYDPIIQALTGHVAVQVNRNIDDPSPDLIRNVVVDKHTSWVVAQAVSSALFARLRGAGGQHINVSMLDASVAFFWPDGMTGHTFVGEGVTPGTSVAQSYRIMATSNGSLVFFCISDAEWQALFGVIERPDLAVDERFATMAARREHLPELTRELRQAFASLDQAEAVERLAAAGVAAAPVLSFDEMIVDPQIVHNGSIVERDHPTAGRIREPRPPIRFGVTDAPMPPIAPLHGEHTDQVLAKLGYSAGRIADLRQRAIIA